MTNKKLEEKAKGWRNSPITEGIIVGTCAVIGGTMFGVGAYYLGKKLGVDKDYLTGMATLIGVLCSSGGIITGQELYKEVKYKL